METEQDTSTDIERLVLLAGVIEAAAASDGHNVKIRILKGRVVKRWLERMPNHAQLRWRRRDLNKLFVVIRAVNKDGLAFRAFKRLPRYMSEAPWAAHRWFCNLGRGCIFTETLYKRYKLIRFLLRDPIW